MNEKGTKDMIDRSTMARLSSRAAAFALTILTFLTSAIPIRADDATLLPNARQVFLDNSGRPLASGKVYFYVPATSTAKTVWSDAEKTTPLPQPVVLNSAGRPSVSGTEVGIYGDGEYRQVVQTSASVTIWDGLTNSTGGGSSSATVGDGLQVGTVLPFYGFTAPSNYALAYGQAISRTTYSSLFTAITISQSGVCVLGSTTISGLQDTSIMTPGAAIEGSCIPPGATISTIASSVSITVSAAATASASATFRILPFGGGDGSATFNLPDLRGRVVPGADAMGGTAASRLTATYYGKTATGLGATGGAESHTLTIAQIPSHQHGIGVSGTAASGGSGNVVAAPAQDFQTAFTGGGGAHPIVQPSITANYIIKITPDSAPAATGVVSLGGMTGVLLCSNGILCASQTVSVDTGYFSSVAFSGKATDLIPATMPQALYTDNPATTKNQAYTNVQTVAGTDHIRIAGNDYLFVCNYYSDATGGENTSYVLRRNTSTGQYTLVAADSNWQVTTYGCTSGKFFQIDNDYYLAITNQFSTTPPVGNFYNGTSAIYKWNGSGFNFGSPFQSIATRGPQNVEVFTRTTSPGAGTYLAIGNATGDANGCTDARGPWATASQQQSEIYRWNGSTFALLQQICTSGAYHLYFFEQSPASTAFYLAVAEFYNGTTHSFNSRIFTYNSGTDQFGSAVEIATIGATYWASFQIGSDFYLAQTNNQADNNELTQLSEIRKWNGSTWPTFQQILTNNGFRVKYNSFGSGIGAQHYITWSECCTGTAVVLANYDNSAAHIYRWNGTSFVSFQQISGNGVYDTKIFSLDTPELYIAVANSVSGSGGVYDRTVDLGVFKLGLLPYTSGNPFDSLLISQGDLFYGSATGVVSTLAKNTTATRYISNTGASNNPAWAQVNLTNGVTGTLPVANGGTGVTTAADNTLFSGPSSGGPLAPSFKTVSAILDSTFSSTQGAILYRGAATWAALGPGTAGQSLQTAGAGGNPSWSLVDISSASEITGQLATANIANNAVDNSKLRDSSALSVIGRSANSVGDPADIAGTANQVFRVDSGGTTLAFGAINLASSSAVTGNLSVSNLNSGTNASFNTYWRGDASWTSPTRMIAGSSFTSVPAGGTRYITWNNTTTLTVANVPIPVAGSMRNLYVSIDPAPGGGTTLAVTLMKNGAATALTCTVTDPATTCNDTTNSVSFTTGDLWTVRAVSTSGAGLTVNWAMRVQD